MGDKDHTYAFGRRLFLAGTGALALMSGSGARASAQESAGGKPAPIAGKQLRQILAEFVVAFDLKQVPPEIVELARLAFIDTVGVAVAGSHDEVAHIAAGMVKLEGTAPQCTIIGQSFKASPQLAALANGVSSHAMDYDFSYVSGQSAAPVIPALLALAESAGATPAEFLGAFIVGCEVVARVGRSSPRISNGGGWQGAGVIGGIGAAAACAKLMKLPVEQVAHAIGISASLVSGLPANYGTMTKPLHVGNGARNGLMAAMLASNGFTSSPIALEGDNGYYASFARALKTDYAPFKDIGSRWDLKETGYSIKYYPCGGRGHTAIDAALLLRDKVGNTNEITNIHCWMSPSSAKRVVTKYPIDVESAKFSASYVVAYSLLYGAPKIKAFTQEALNDARIKALAGLVTASADPQLSDEWGNPTRVRITLKDGGTLQEQRDYPIGSTELPLTEAQVEEKFMDCAMQTISEDAARKLFAIASTITDRPSFGDFWSLLRKA
jgi:2-methylcitrate dehydratase PrpD